MAQQTSTRKRVRRTFTLEDPTYEHLTSLAEDADTSRSRLVEQFVYYDHQAYERLTHIAAAAAVSPSEFLQQAMFLNEDPHQRLTRIAAAARATPSQFLEHLILRAEAIYNFEPPAPPQPRPWWKLWVKNPVPEIPALVADLRNPTSP